MTITRRDFLNGTALSIAAGIAPGQLLAATGPASASYPPALTGLRGNHAGTYTLAHSLAREGATYPGVLAREAYDLVVIGGGIGGLAAAWFYQRQFGNKRRILILDNHDDFGGHAKRNEFTVRGRTLVTYGGSAEMPPSANDNTAVKTLLAGLGIEPTAQARALPGQDYERRGMGRAVFFDAAHFGRDQWLAGDPFAGLVDMRLRGGPVPTVGTGGTDALRDFLAQAPLPPPDRDALLRLAQGSTDFLAGMPADARRSYLQATRYAAFLRDKAGIGLGGLRFLRSRSQDAYALDADGISVAQAIAIALPAGAGTPEPVVDPGLGKSPASRQWFADGNATLARALVAQLVAGVLPPGAKASGDARIDYGKLDQDGNAVRIRLNSTAIAVEPDVRITRVTYGWQGNLQRVEAQHVIVAGYGMMVPFILPTLPAPAKAALRAEVKAPLVYSKVALDNWRAFDALKTWRIHAPTMAYSDLWLEAAAGGRDDPVVLHMLYVPSVPDSGMQARERFRAGRAFLLGTPFDVLERDIRAQLDRMLAAGGFSAARDIRGITVNRWAHGYSYMPSTMVPGDANLQAALEQAGRGVGNVRIAGADVAGSPSVTAAIDQAQRAVSSLRADS